MNIENLKIIKLGTILLMLLCVNLTEDDLLTYVDLTLIARNIANTENKKKIKKLIKETSVYEIITNIELKYIVKKVHNHYKKVYSKYYFKRLINKII